MNEYKKNYYVLCYNCSVKERIFTSLIDCEDKCKTFHNDEIPIVFHYKKYKLALFNYTMNEIIINFISDCKKGINL